MKLSATVLKKMILAADRKVSAKPGKIMGKQSLVFSEKGKFRYAIYSTKDRLTLHTLPMYCEPSIRKEFEPHLDGKFSKGCVHFKLNSEIDKSSLARFLKKCAKVPSH